MMSTARQFSELARGFLAKLRLQDGGLSSGIYRLKKYLGQSVLVLSIFVFAISIGISFDRLHEEQILIDEKKQIDAWLIAQVELEFLRLQGALEAHFSAVRQIPREELVERLEIFWSRLPILLEGSEAQRLRSLEGFEARVVGIQKKMEVLDPILLALDRGDRTTFLVLRAQFRDIQKAIHQLVGDVMINSQNLSSEYQESLKSLYFEMVLYFIGILVSATVLVLVLIRQVRKVNALLHSTQEAEAGATAARERLFEAIESISEGFVLCDAADRLVLTNTKFREFVGIPWEKFGDGSVFEDVLRAMAYAGAIPVAIHRVEDWLAVRMEQHLAGTTS